MRSNGPVATKELAMTGREWPGGLVASHRYKEDLYISAANTGHSSRLAESGCLVRGMSHRVDPAAIAEEARTTRLDAVLGPPDSPFRWGIVQRQNRGL
jgi:hypothetical protein